MQFTRKIIVIVRADESTEVLSTTLSDTEPEIQRHHQWCCKHYLGVDVLIADCVITPREQAKPDLVKTSKRIVKPKPAESARTASMLPPMPEWTLWLKVNADAKRFPPVPSGKDTSAGKRLYEALGKDLVLLEKVYRAYLNDDSPWNTGHGFALRHLEAQVNKYLNNDGENVCTDPTLPGFDIDKVKIV